MYPSHRRLLRPILEFCSLTEWCRFQYSPVGILWLLLKYLSRLNVLHRIGVRTIAIAILEAYLYHLPCSVYYVGRFDTSVSCSIRLPSIIWVVRPSRTKQGILCVLYPVLFGCCNRSWPILRLYLLVKCLFLNQCTSGFLITAPTSRAPRTFRLGRAKEGEQKFLLQVFYRADLIRS